jgi:hypothetical protein
MQIGAWSCSHRRGSASGASTSNTSLMMGALSINLSTVPERPRFIPFYTVEDEEYTTYLQRILLRNGLPLSPGSR